jgi:hypothetical protein
MQEAKEPVLKRVLGKLTAPALCTRVRQNWGALKAALS